MSENKNLVLAVVLCLAVLFGWSYLSEFMGWTPPREQPALRQAPEITPTPEKSAPPARAFTPVPGRDFIVETPLYKATIHTGGGVLNSFILKNYRATIEPDSPPVNLVSAEAARVSPLGLLINSQASWSMGQWQAETGGEGLELGEKGKGSLALLGQVDGLDVRRQLEFDADTYLIRETITLRNGADHSRTVRLGFTQAMSGDMVSGDRYDRMRVAWDENGSLEDEADSKDLLNGVQATGQIYWAGPMSTYFLCASLPGESAGATMKGLVDNNIYRVALEQADIVLAAGETREVSTSYWLGPKERALMEEVSDQLIKSIDFGYFSYIGKVLTWAMEFFYKYCRNWGVAILLLTLALRLLLWPLNSMSFKSMEKMRQLAPYVKEINEKHKGDRAAAQKAVLELYRTYNVKPAGGCVPMIVQLPIFFGLYQGLLNSLALRHAAFIPYLPGTDIVWLADLSAKDPLYITPILMGLAMFAQQKMSPPMGDPMQQKMMMFLPLIFTVFFATMPSGLVIYWLFNNLFQMFQQWLFMRKSKKSPQPTPAPAAAAPTPRAKETRKK